MRKQERGLWIIYILLMEYVVSINTCESGASLGELNFGYILPRSAFTTKYQVSPYQCAIECHLRIQRCKSFNYRRSALSCQLCEEDSGPGGNNLQPKAGSIHSNIDTWKNLPLGPCNMIHCSRTQRCDSSKKAGETNICLPAECPFAELKLGMTIEPSNETVVRTKARRRCMSHNMERGEPITTCLENTAEWSNPDFKCVCSTPRARSGTIMNTTEVEVGHNYTYKCQAGLIPKTGQNPTVTCLQDGSWTSTNFTCVCINPPAKSGIIISTSEVEIGQNYTYKCQDGLVAKAGQTQTVTCLPDGNWTSMTFTCVCNNPLMKYGAINEMAEVEVGQNYSYKCQSGLFEKGDLNPTITCLEDGSWTSTNFQCVKQNWKQDTIYYSNMYTSDLISNVIGIDLLECMRQCDDIQTNCLSFFYDNHASQCLLSSSFRRGLPKYLQSSAGLVYYTAPSNSCDMGYMNVSLGGSSFCIKSYSILKTFHQAMDLCESEKAKVLVITTKDQIADLKPHLPVGFAFAFAGIWDLTEEGTWISWDGKVVYPFWNPGEPNEGRLANCGCIASDSIGLIDLPCIMNMNFVCSKT